MLQTMSIRALVAIQSLVRSLHRDERGQDMLEWVLLGGMVALGIVTVAVVFTGALNTMIGNLGNCLDFTSATACTPGF